MDHLAGELDPNHKEMLDKYLAERPKLYQDLKGSASTWEELLNVETPAPSPQLNQRFEAMLAGYTSARRQKVDVLANFRSWLQVHWQPSLVSLIVGLVIGFLWLPEDTSEVRTLTGEVQEMKKMLMLSMIDKPQAQERIKAVNMVSSLSSEDDRITTSLFTTLNNDGNVNVRLAALDALLHYAGEPAVRTKLIESIALQESPLMQVALADAMLLLQEKQAVEQFDKILESNRVDKSVRLKLESTIETLKEI